MNARQRVHRGLRAPFLPPERTGEARVYHAFLLRKAPWPWRRALSAGLSLFAVVALGALFHRPADGLLASIGAFTGIYATDLPLKQLAAKLAAVGLGLTASFALGAATSAHLAAAAIALALVGGIATYVAAALSMAPPGPFFFVMAAAIASGQPPGRGFAVSVAWVLAGAAVAWTLSVFLAMAWRGALPAQASRLRRITRKRLARTLKARLRLGDPAFMGALRMAVGLFASAMIAHALGSPRGYWTAVGCAATLVGMTVVGTLQRAIQRALGTALGVVLASAVLSVHPAPLELALLLFALQTVAELLIPRNYGLAVIFITPLAMLIAETGQADLSAPAIAEARLLNTLVGCGIGLALRLLWRVPFRT
ncbi:FUSC family protein [Alicyclobacillus fructus]|uniref:FUSC family protein n=1 Tax=Alicyclobacillus fructus TaxID=2816082 RepID=UPI001A8D8FA6|nr:FUSC family protein [Alicyclobacillus fructus]